MQRFSRWFVPAGAGAAAALGLLVLAGWALGIPAIKSVAPGLVTMKANTALCFLLSGSALWCLYSPTPAKTRRLAGIVLSGVVVVIAGLTLIEDSLGRDFGIDQLFFTDDTASLNTRAPGRMAIATAISFCLLGLALLSLSSRRFWPSMGGVFALLAHLLASVALVGYLLGVPSLYGVAPFSSMALHTAMGLWVLGAAVLFARPRGGVAEALSSPSLGGRFARRLFLLIPAIVAIGWAVHRGSQAGWYDQSFGLALTVVATMLFTAGLVARQAKELVQVDEARGRAIQDLVRLNAELDQRVENRTQELRKALEEVTQLRGIIPICAWCKRIRDDANYWHQVEAYIAGRTGVQFSHGICPDCMAKQEAREGGGPYLHRDAVGPSIDPE